jgi:hypothetical protein
MIGQMLNTFGPVQTYEHATGTMGREPELVDPSLLIVQIAAGTYVIIRGFDNFAQSDPFAAGGAAFRALCNLVKALRLRSPQVERGELRDECSQRIAGAGGNAPIALIGDHGSQFVDLLNAKRRDDPELSQVASQGIDQHCPLPDQKIAETVRDERCLLLRSLDRHEAHGGPAHGLADGFGIGRIVLVALHVRFDVAGRHQAHVMPVTGDLSRPEVRGAAGLNADNTGRQSGKEARDLAPPEAPAQNDLPGSVNPVELENMLRDIDPDGANLVHGWLLFW